MTELNNRLRGLLSDLRGKENKALDSKWNFPRTSTQHQVLEAQQLAYRDAANSVLHILRPTMEKNPDEEVQA